MFKINITCECHFASASVVFDDGRASAIVDFGLRCTPDVVNLKCLIITLNCRIALSKFLPIIMKDITCSYVYACVGIDIVKHIFDLQISGVSSLLYCTMALDLDKWPIFSLLEPEFLAKVRLACVFGSSGNEAILITRDDDVYALGSNCSGCLGLGEFYSFRIP